MAKLFNTILLIAKVCLLGGAMLKGSSATNALTFGLINTSVYRGINMMKSKQTLLFVFSILLLLMAQPALAEIPLNMPKGVTPISREIYDLHMTIFWVCVVIAIIVFGVMIYSMIMHRKSRGAKATNFHESTSLELAWTIVPLIVLIFIAVPATKTLINLENTEKADLTVKITGWQWKWQYEYMPTHENSEANLSFFSNLAKSNKEAIKDDAKRAELEKDTYLLDVDRRLVLPVGKRIRFLMTSNDVIHSWWVPMLGVKQDTNPGFINDSWALIEEPGVYRGKCAELCGKDHGFMPVVVEALPEEEYNQWMAQQLAEQKKARAAAGKTMSMDQLLAKGKEVYDTSCAACHGATGGGVPGAFPAMTGSPIVQGDINGHIDIILNGKAGTAMQAFKAQLNDAEIAAVVTYERNALGNSVGDLAQPASIKARR